MFLDPTLKGLLTFHGHVSVATIAEMSFFFFLTTYSILNFHFLSGLVVTFVYIKSSDLAVEKPPLPDKAKQKDILQRYVELKVICLNEPPLQCNFFVRSENTSDHFLFIRLESNIHHKSDDDGIVPNDEKEG